jgi:GNAT superfamily N-acetyltransferase
MEKQICKQCGASKPLADFYKNKIKKNGHDSKCKLCRSTRAKQYRADNQEAIKQQRKQFYNDNRDRLVTEKRQYYQDNKDKVRKTKRDSMRRNRASILVYQKGYRAENKEVLAAKRKIYRDNIIHGIIELLGGECSICGEDNTELLSLDHVHDDGNEERKKFNSITIKRKLLKGELDKNRYRLLCHTCNVGRYALHPIHQRKIKDLTGQLKLCPTCLLEKDEAEFHDHGKTLYYECEACKRWRRWILKIEVIKLLGGECACCGAAEPYKLVVDHVLCDGSARRKSGEKTGEGIYRALKKGILDKTKYQVLCVNCNISRHLGHGTCVHARETKEYAGKRKTYAGERKTTIKTAQFKLDDIMINAGDVEGFLEQHHYIGFGRSSVISYAITLGQKLVAAVKFSTPVRVSVATKMGYEFKEVIELDRLCIHPDFHRKNFASWLLARIIKRIKEDLPAIRCIVSFADPSAGHIGTVYKAANWKELGKTARSYFYINQDNEILHKKTLYNRARSLSQTEREYADLHGYSRVWTPPKIKFAYEL